MNELRVYGNPFRDCPASGQLRSFLRLFATVPGARCALVLADLDERAPEPGERLVPLHDGNRDRPVATRLPPAELAPILQAVRQHVAATAPLVVFGADEHDEHDEGADRVRLAGLAFPDACAVLGCRPRESAPELLHRAMAALRWAGSETQTHALPRAELLPWLELARGRRDVLVHVAERPFVAGTGLLFDALARAHTDGSLSVTRLRVVVPTWSARAVEQARERFRTPPGVAVEYVRQPFAPEHVADAAAIVLPHRTFGPCEARTLVLSLASGRPVCTSRWRDNAALLHGRGVAHTIGGRTVSQDAEHGPHFSPQPQAVSAALQAALAERVDASGLTATGDRARAHVVGGWTAQRPASPPPPVPAIGAPTRPSVVLEAPMLETSSSAELTIATARALVARGNVDVSLVPNAPFEHDLDWLRRRAPELVTRLVRRPARPDLWLSSGWPVRASRPDCRHWALRVDWEYGALPSELTPHVTEDADTVVVHSEYVYRVLTAAGRPMPQISVVPHGVDEAMRHDRAPCAEVTAFKAGRPAVLFCGGMVFRKGFDVFVGAVLEARRRGHDFVVVVKPVGGGSHYRRGNLGSLLDRLRSIAGAPPVMVLDRDHTRDELASVFTACDVLLHPYRGEGFGMPVLEARACGLPVIVTGRGATEPLLGGGGGVHRIDSENRPVDLPGAHVSRPWLLEPSLQSAVTGLERLFGERERSREIARKLAPAVRGAYSWDAAAAGIEALAARGVQRRRRGEVCRDAPSVVVPQAPPVARAVAPRQPEPARG